MRSTGRETAVDSVHDRSVIVVGGGPVGLVAALAISQRGFPVTVLEKRPNLDNTEWRGSTLHPPTLEILEEIGILNPVLEDGIKLEDLQYRDADLEGVASFPYSLLEGYTRHPYRIQYEQYKVVRLLKKAIEASNVDIRYEHEVVGIEQHPDSATVHVDSPGRSEQKISAAWVVAADGAHSPIRHLLKLDFDGFTFPTQTVVVATEIDFAQELKGLPPVTYWNSPNGRVSLIRTPDIWRVAASTSTDVNAEVSEYSVDAPHPDLILGLSAVLGRELRGKDLRLRQHQMYKSHQRVAGTFLSGRVVLIGDAAHLSSTTGGMGLNSGVHDAFALANALAEKDVVRAVTTFAEGRRKIAEDYVQPATIKKRRETEMRESLERDERLNEMLRLASDEEKARDYLIDVSMLRVAGVAYSALKPDYDV